MCADAGANDHVNHFLQELLRPFSQCELGGGGECIISLVLPIKLVVSILRPSRVPFVPTRVHIALTIPGEVTLPYNLAAE